MSQMLYQYIAAAETTLQEAQLLLDTLQTVAGNGGREEYEDQVRNVFNALSSYMQAWPDAVGSPDTLYEEIAPHAEEEENY